MTLKEIKLETGRLLVPEYFIILKSTITESADYAGVIQDRDHLLPRYVYLSEKPVATTIEEIEQTIEICGREYPAVKEYYEKQIRIAVWENNKLKNAKEVNETTMVSLFAIPDVADEYHLYEHCGIIRKPMERRGKIWNMKSLFKD